MAATASMATRRRALPTTVPSTVRSFRASDRARRRTLRCVRRRHSFSPRLWPVARAGRVRALPASRRLRLTEGRRAHFAAALPPLTLRPPSTWKAGSTSWVVPSQAGGAHQWKSVLSAPASEAERQGQRSAIVRPRIGEAALVAGADPEATGFDIDPRLDIDCVARQAEAGDGEGRPRAREGGARPVAALVQAVTIGDARARQDGCAAETSDRHGEAGADRSEARPVAVAGQRQAAGAARFGEAVEMGAYAIVGDERRERRRP